MDVVADQLLEDAWGSLIVAVYVLTLFVGAEVVHRTFKTPTEWTRKGTHIGAGVIVMAFPWLLTHTVSVVLLALSFAGILIGGRVTGLLGSIHNVKRSTGGAYYYPFAVLFTWVLSHGDPLLFCLPLAIMAVADTGAALVGQRAGQTQYQVMDGVRSVEGSMAFFSLAFSIVLVACAIAGEPGWPDMLLVTLVVASLTTAVEAVSVRGSDNILIPYAAWLAMERTLRLGLEQLGDWIEGMGLAMVVLFATTTRARLTTSGAVTVFLVVTVSWALGGTAWLAPLAILYAMFILGRPAELKTEVDVVFPTAGGAMLVLLAYAHTDDATLYAPYLVAVAASGSIAGWLLAEARRWNKPGAAVVGGAAPALSGVGFELSAAPIAAVGAVVGLAGFLALDRAGLVGRRVVATTGVAVAAWWLG